MELDQKIIDVIKQGLPEATVGAFKERIEELDNLAKQVPFLNTKISNLAEELTKVKKERDLLKSYETRLNEITNTEQHLVQKCNDLNLREGILKVKTELMETRVLDHKEMFNVVFRNTTLRNSIHSTAVGGENESGPNNSYSNRSNNQTKDVLTTKVEE